MQNKWYIKLKSGSFLKPMYTKDGLKEYGFESLQSKQEELSKSFETEEAAKDYLDNLLSLSNTPWTTTSIGRLKMDLALQWTSGASPTVEHFQTLIDVVCDKLNKDRVVLVRAPRLHTGSGDRQTDPDVLLNGVLRHIGSELIYTCKVRDMLKGAKIIMSVPKIKFYPKQKRLIKWEDAPTDLTEYHVTRKTCHRCGVSVPGMKYLHIPAHARQSSDICAFCVGRLAEEVNLILDNISPEIKKEYKVGKFLDDL